MLIEGGWLASSLVPVACSSSLPQPRGSFSSWAAHANTPPASAKTEQGEAYLVSPACSDRSRSRGAPVGRSRGAVTFFTATAVCRGVSVHVLCRATGLGEGLCFQVPSLWKHNAWVFSAGMGRGVSCVLRDNIFLSLSVWWETSRLSPSLVGGWWETSRFLPSLMGRYWRFGRKENLSLKKCAYSVACFGWCGSSDKQQTTGTGGWVMGYVGCDDKEKQKTVQGNTRFSGGRTTHQFHCFTYPSFTMYVKFYIWSFGDKPGIDKCENY